MSREIMIIAKDKNGVISNNIVKIGENGEHIVIKGTKDTFYEIKDMATNRAPDQIYTKRFKNDLKLKINPKGGALDGVGEADVTIENYCANGNCEIVGVHESGEYYQYVPQSGDADLGTTKMADGEFAYQSLGTVEAGGFGPLSALPLAGLAGLGGGGGGKKPDTTAPDAPNLTMVNDDVDSFSFATGGVWGYDDDTGSWGIDNATGGISISGNVNVTSDGKIITNDNTPTLSGTGEVGATVKVYAENGYELTSGQTIIVDSNGNWSAEVDLSELYPSSPYTSMDMSGNLGAGGNPGEDIKLSVTLTDAAGNESASSAINFILDTLFLSNLGNITLTDGNKTMESESSKYTYFTGTSLTMSDDFMANAIDNKGTNTAENISYNEGTEIYITLTEITFGKDSNGNIIQIRGAEHRIGVDSSAVVGADGKWSVDIDFAKYGLQDGVYDTQISVRDISGDTFGISNGSVLFGIDRHAPEKAIIDNHVSIGADNVVSFHVTDYEPIYINADGEKVGLGPDKLIFYRDGSTTSAGEEQLTDDTDITWKDPANLDDGLYMYQVDTVDVAGNHSGLSEKGWAYFDNDTSHDLTTADNASAKCFDEMVLVGSNTSETFIVDNVGFVSIDAKTGTDTFVLQGTGLILDIAKTKNFEVYNINGNKLTINGDVNADSDHIVINGTSSATVDLSTDWSMSASQTQSGYTIYTNTGSDALWIQNTAVVNI